MSEAKESPDEALEKLLRARGEVPVDAFSGVLAMLDPSDRDVLLTAALDRLIELHNRIALVECAKHLLCSALDVKEQGDVIKEQIDVFYKKFGAETT